MDQCEAEVVEYFATHAKSRQCSRRAVTERTDWKGRTIRVCSQHHRKLALLKYDAGK